MQIRTQFQFVFKTPPGDQRCSWKRKAVTASDAASSLQSPVFKY